MKNITKVLSLLLIAAAIVLASARSTDRSNETCTGEWNHVRAMHSNVPVEIAQADTIRK